VIKTGMLADLTVLDRNILKIDPKSIKDSKVTRTIVDGKKCLMLAINTFFNQIQSL
jgi:predicted amidohydrolase YtcJ